MNRLDETNVCYLCDTTHDCSQGNEVKALSGEWVCLSCQDKLISELAPKIKADAVRGIRQNVPMTNNGIEGFYSYLDIIDYANKLEGRE